MKKLQCFTLIFTLMQMSTFAVSASLNELPKSEREIYNALPSEVQAQTVNYLQKMGYYDPEHTHLDSTGHFFIVDDSLDKIMKDNGIVPPPFSLTHKNIISNNPPSGYTPEGVPIFHSFPGSPYVLYLNFLGGHLRGTAWNVISGNPDLSTQPYSPAAYNPNHTPGFPVAVQNAIAGIWGRVTEDFAPWQIDVTTENPGPYTMTMAIALITSDTTTDGKPMPAIGAGGTAEEDIFGYGSSYYTPALIYYNNLLGGDEDAVADVVSHEIGHNFGLSHEGILGGSPYFPGFGVGEISWGCIMGAPYFKTVTKFCIGDYPQANNQEDQLAIIAGSLPYRNPSAGSTPATATPLIITNGTFLFSGIIQDYSSSNVFVLPNILGNLSVSAATYRRSVDTLGNNLCLSLLLFNSVGRLIAMSSNPYSCSASLNASSLPLDTYYIQVYPVGSTITPFSVYGSVGQYDLSGTLTSSCVHVNPTVTLTPASQSVSPGGTSYYTVSVANNDPSSCDSELFQLSSVLPAGITGSFSTSSLSVKSGSTATATLNLTVSSGVSLGDYTISATATNQTANSFTATSSAKLNVVAATCKLGIFNLKPVSTSLTIARGSSGTYVLMIQNTDSIGCAPTTLNFSSKSDAGITTSASPMTLTPGQTLSGNITVNVANTVSSGRHSVNLYITDPNNAYHNRSGGFYVVVP